MAVRRQARYSIALKQAAIRQIIPWTPGSIQAPKLFDQQPTAGDLETFWLLCLFVAGKNARVQQGKLNALLEFFQIPSAARPLDHMRALPARRDTIEVALKACKVGQYRRLLDAIEASIDSLRILTTPKVKHRRETLVSIIPGAGMKTASFFCMYGHGDRVAVLDTHIMAHMREKQMLPRSIDISKPEHYRQVEQIFLDWCQRDGCAPWDRDLEIWKSRTKSL